MEPNPSRSTNIQPSKSVLASNSSHTSDIVRMSALSLEEERRRIAASLLLHRHQHQSKGATTTMQIQPGFQPPFSTSSFLTPPPGWTVEQYQLFLSRKDSAYRQISLLGHYALKYPTYNVTDAKAISQPEFFRHSHEKAPPSISAKVLGSGCHGPLLVQAASIEDLRQAAAVTPSPKRSPSPLASTNNEPSQSFWSEFSHQKSLAVKLMELPSEIRLGVCLIAVHIERRSLSQPWGLGFVNMAADRMMVSKVTWNENHVRRHWCQGVAIRAKDCIEIKFDPMMVYTNKPLYQCANDAAYAAKLFSSIHQGEANSVPVSRSHHFCPGDLVVAVDGHPMSSFGSLTGVTRHLKSVHKTTIVVARNSKLVATGSLALQGGVDATSEAANQVWNDILPVSCSVAFKISKPAAHRVLFAKPPPRHSIVLRNPLFRGDDGKGLPYDDNDKCHIPGDGTGVDVFLPRIDSFPDWLAQKKATWRRKYTVYKHAQEMLKKRQITNKSPAGSDNDEECNAIARDFWTHQGYGSFNKWMSTRVSQWKISYSWNKRKRKRIQQDCEEIVHISSEPLDFAHWLSIRRRQWRLQRRKRQRFKEGDKNDDAPTFNENQSPIEFGSGEGSPLMEVLAVVSTQSRTAKSKSTEDREMTIIDAIIEAEESQRRRRAEIKSIPIDIAKFFDSSYGIPDDIIVKCFEFLECKDHIRVLTINRSTSNSLKARNNVWKSLCPSHWVLPRRPRKPWHELYCSRVKSEHDLHQKRWDDLLVKCAAILDSSDSLCKIEKLIEGAQRSFGFDVNYISGVVCERNSVLNLAVIHKRHKVTRWLVDVKKADIETFDRGKFTPLLNAAWEGDRAMVRFFLQKGADRSVRGTQHYSKAIAPPGFEGMTADQWADKRGHPEVAKLIRLGL